MSEAGIKLVCRVCQKQYANYTCPRCNVRYCSLPCYKKHSLRCTEALMRDNVVEEMKNVQISSDSKRKMLEALKRVNAEDPTGMNITDADLSTQEDDANEETVLTEETLQKIVDGKELTLSDLSPAELKAFQRAVAAGELRQFIQPWEPWWLNPAAKTISLTTQGTSLILPVEDQPPEQEERQRSFPPPPAEPLPPLELLSSAQPSSLLPVHLVELVYSYCFVLRLYNGEWSENASDSAADLLAISRVLSQSAAPETISEVISYCLETVCSPAFRHAGGFELGVLVCSDTSAILRNGKPVIICALEDLRRMLEKSIREKRTRVLQAAARKVYFIMCWANEFGDGLSSFAALVDAEREKLAETRASPQMPGEARVLEKLSKTQTLTAKPVVIEELT